MANVLKIKRGSGVPSGSDLAVYELGYRTGTNELYINDDGNYTQVGSAGSGGGDIEGVTAGTGLSGGGSSGTVTLTNAGVTSIVAGSNISISGATGAVTVTGTDTNTQLSTEQVQDIVGGMFSSNTETRIAATYEDGDGTIDLVVTDMRDYLSATDDRDFKPNTIDTSGQVRAYFTTLEGMTGSAGSDYQDMLVLDTYADGTGGDSNALIFDKSTQLIKHYLADQAASTWGTPKTIAYTDSTMTGTWNGTAIASAYLDADTAHLSGTQTFSGSKTFSSHLILPDNVLALFGAGNVFQIGHKATYSQIAAFEGHLYIDNNADDSDIVFRSDDGSGGLANYIVLDGSTNSVAIHQDIKLTNTKKLYLDNGLDTYINEISPNEIGFTTAAAERMRITTTGVNIPVAKKLFFGGGSHTYIGEDVDDRLRFFTGGAEYMRFTETGSGILGIYRDIYMGDNLKLHLGASNDLRLWHDGSNSIMYAYGTGNLYIGTTVDDGDVILVGDDGSGGTADYLTIDGGSVITRVHKLMRFDDNVDLRLGLGSDLRLYHTGSHSYMTNYTGDLVIRNYTDDGDVKLESDDGSGGTHTYLKLDGGSKFLSVPSDSVQFTLGASADIRFYHDGTNSHLKNYGGAFYIAQNASSHLYIDNNGDNQDIILRSDDGSGGITAYLTLDGGAERIQFDKKAYIPDNVKFEFGTGADLQIYHDASNSHFVNTTGNLTIVNTANDKDIIFQTDNGSGSTTNYLQLDGSELRATFDVHTRFNDNKTVQIGSAADLQLYHDASNSYIAQTGTGDLIIQQSIDDKDIIFKCDDGGGGMNAYITLDGSAGTVVIAKPTYVGGSSEIQLDSANSRLLLTDNTNLKIGTGGDFVIFHNATDTFLRENTGNLYIDNLKDDKDIILRSDDGSGGVTSYITLDGSASKVTFFGSRIDVNSDGTMNWGSGAAHGRLTWDTGQAVITTLGSNDLTLTAAGGRSVIVNNYQSNVDFRVESDSSANLLHCDATLDKVGIGTASPADKLHVYGTSGTTQVRIETTADAGAQIRYKNDSQSWIVGINSNDQYAWYSSQLATNAAMIHVDGYFYSYKGIRLSTNNIPLQARDAAGNLANLMTLDTGDILRLGDTDHIEQIAISTASTTNQMILSSSGISMTGNVTMSSPLTVNYGATINEGGNDSDFRVESQGNTSMLRVDASANRVGIGTGSPSEALHVVGDVFFNGQLHGGFGAKSTGGSTDWNNSLNSRSGCGYTLLREDATNGPGNAPVNSANDHYFHTLNFEYASHDNDGNMTQIGFPYYFANEDGVRPVIRSRYGGTWSSYHNLITGNANGQIQASAGTEALPSYSFNGNGYSDLDTGIYGRTANQIGFSVNAHDQFYVADGAIHIEQPVRIQFANDQRIYDNGSGGLNVGAQSHELKLYSGGTDPIQFMSGGRSGTVRMTMLSTGLFGIGTASPLALLDLGNGTGQKFYVYSSSAIRSGLGIDLSGTSRELSYFHTSSNAADGQHSWGYRLEGDGSYVERMQLTGAGHLTLNAGGQYIGDSTSGVLSTGSWYGDLGSNGFERVAGLSHDGGEFVIVEKGGRVSTLVDGNYFAYESGGGTGGGFFSSTSSNYANAPGIRASAASELYVIQWDGGASDLTVSGMIKANGTGGFTIGNVAGAARIQEASNEFAFLTTGNAYANIYTNDIIANGKIIHYGDTNTYMQFSAADTWKVYAGGQNPLTAIANRVYINASGANGLLINNDEGNSGNSARIFFEGTSTSAIFQEGNDMSFRSGATTGSSSGTERFKIDNNGDVTISGGSLTLPAAEKLYLDGTTGNTYINRNSGSSSRVDFTVNSTNIVNLFNTHLMVNGPIYAGTNTDTNGSVALAVRLAGDDLYNVWGSQYSSGKMMMGNNVKPRTGAEGFVSSADNSATTKEAVTMGIGNWSYYTAASAQTTLDAVVTMTERVRFDTSGNGHFDADVVAYSSTVSDERLKDNIQTIPNALDKVMQLRGVEFDWNATSRKGQHDIGVIAQEVEKVLPEVVKEHTLCTGEFTDNEKEFKTVDYDKMIGVLIEAIKQQQVQIDELKTQIGE